MIFFSIQAIRVVVPLVPAGPVILAGVAVFDPWWGFALSLLGAFSGSVSAFLLARHFSRPMVARLVGEKTLEKHSGKMGADGRWMLVALMMPSQPPKMRSVPSQDSRRFLWGAWLYSTFWVVSRTLRSRSSWHTASTRAPAAFRPVVAL